MVGLGFKNGELLRKAAEAGFEVLLTMDSNMAQQQDLKQQGIAIVVLKAASNRLADTRPLIPDLLSRLSQVRAGTLTILPAE